MGSALRRAVLAASCVLTAALWGCHGGDRDDGRVRLRLSGYVSSPAETALMKKLVTTFNARHPKVEVTYEPVPGQYYPKLLTMLVSHTAPDVFYMDISAFAPTVSKGVLRPLNDFLAASTGTATGDFIPSLMQAFTDGDQVYGIPKDFNTLALFYNKAMFDRAGLAYPDASWDLARLRHAAIALTHGDVHGLAITHDNADRYLPIARMFGAKLYGKDGACALAGPEAQSAMDYYAGLKLRDGAAIYPNEVGSSWTGDAFGRENVAMAFEGGWLVPYLAETFPQLDYGVAELPHGPAGRSNFLFTVAYVMPKQAAHPEEAWQLIEYLTSEEAESQVTFALPSRKAIAKRYAESHPSYRPIVAGAAYARPYAFGPKGDRIKNRLGVAVQEVFLGAKGTPGALGDAAHDIDQMNRM